MNEIEDDNDPIEVKISATLRLNTIKRLLAQSEIIKNKINNNREYAYTVSNGILSQEQRDFYEKNGFLVIKNLISAEKLEKFKARFQKICAEKKKIPGMTVNLI